MATQTQAIAVVESPALHVQKFNREQVDLIKRTICKGATDDELQMFIMQAERLGLDPLARQVFAIKRWDSGQGRDVMAIQTSIDGFRLIAERSGRYRGQEGPFWCGDDGEWTDVWLKKEPPAAAKVGVWKEGFKLALFAVARYGAYVQTKKDGNPNSMWAKMPDIMLAKCAESLALRKAFPQETSGIYTREEMGQAEDERPSQGEVAERRIAEEKTKLAKQLYEDRAQANMEAADAVPLNMKTTIEQFQALKEQLGPFQNLYYDCLKRHGVAHSNEFKPGDRKKAVDCYKDLAKLVIEYKAKREEDLVGGVGVSDEDLPLQFGHGHGDPADA